MKQIYGNAFSALKHHDVAMTIRKLDQEHKRLEDLHTIIHDSSQNDLTRILNHLGLQDAPSDFLRNAVETTFKYYRDKNLEFISSLPQFVQPFKELRTLMDLHLSDSSILNKHLIMCSMCSERSAVTKCDQCEDEFCHLCFVKVHSTGNRRFHSSVEIPQLVCVSCDKAFASQLCDDCGLFFCETCFPTVHAKRPEFVKHRKRNISGQTCNECEEGKATLLCENCHDLFCATCFMNMHRQGNRKSHSYLTIDPTGYFYRDGKVLDKKETEALLHRVRFPPTVNSHNTAHSNESPSVYVYSRCSYCKVSLIDQHNEHEKLKAAPK